MEIHTVDAFTSKPFTGNPAAVCLLEDDIADELKQQIAKEMNISETAFVTKQKQCDKFSTSSSFNLRWFTPSTEVALCGHATLAAATVIFRIAGNSSKVISFSTASGILTAEREHQKIVLELPVNPPTEVPRQQFLQLVELAACGLPVKQVLLSTKTKKLLVRLEDQVTRHQLETIAPQIDQFTAVKQTDVKGVIVTMKGEGDYDFLSRYFAPWVAIPEDPVTGSAHTVLTPYWANTLQRKQLRARQCSPRGGDLDIILGEDKVRVAGESVIILSGTINI